MYFERIYDEGLAQASYLIACAATGEALIVDPLRDLDIYFDKTDELGFEIVGIAETHIHADFLSGGRDLARATGATLYISGEQEEGWLYDELDGLEVVEVADGDNFKVGNIAIEGLHTPGHTPEHMSFLVTDTVQADEPMMALTGDFAFVGDLGRPDLLEKAAGERGTAVEGARQQFESVRDKLVTLPDHVQIWPGHGAGSACGKALGSIPASTVGYERRNAWWGKYIDENDPDGFVEELLADQPESPTYFRNMKQMNRDGVPGGYELPALAELTPAGFRRAVEEEDALVLDIRDIDEFGPDHYPGSLNLPSLANVSDHAGWAVPYDRPLVVLTDPENLDEARRRLYRVGFTDFAGYIPRLDGYTDERASYATIDADEAHEADESDEALILDVRAESEYREGHIPGALHVHFGRIRDNLKEIPNDVPLVVHCASGRRASVAISQLEAAGYDNLSNFPGGVGEWEEAGYEVE